MLLVMMSFIYMSSYAQTVLYAEKDDSGMGGGDFIVVYFYPDGTLWAKKPTAQYAEIIMRDPQTKDEFKNQAKNAAINQDYSNGYRYVGPAYLNSGTWRVYKNIQKNK